MTLGGGFKHFLCSPRTLGKWTSLTSIFLERGWFSHQLVNHKYTTWILQGYQISAPRSGFLVVNLGPNFRPLEDSGFIYSNAVFWGFFCSRKSRSVIKDQGIKAPRFHKLVNRAKNNSGFLDHICASDFFIPAWFFMIPWISHRVRGPYFDTEFFKVGITPFEFDRLILITAGFQRFQEHKSHSDQLQASLRHKIGRASWAMKKAGWSSSIGDFSTHI